MITTNDNDMWESNELFELFAASGYVFYHIETVK